MNTHNPEWEVTVQDVKQLLDSDQPHLLLDVRQPEEHATCRIESAHLQPLPDLPNNLEAIKELANGRPIIVMCHHGGRSLQAAALLREAGYADIKSMAGGIDAWSLIIDQTVPRY